MARCFMIRNYISPDTTAKTAAFVAAGTSNVFNRTITYSIMVMVMGLRPSVKLLRKCYTMVMRRLKDA